MSTSSRTHETLRSDDAISAFGRARSTVEGAPLSPAELGNIDAYWRASLYLCLGMLYLQDNPLLREPLKIEHVKPRMLGHWGSDAGQTFTYIHFNRLIKKYDLNAIYLSGPGHGAPSVLSQGYLEGTYSEIYPDKSEDLAGLQRFFRKFSFPGGIGSHATPETPGSINEGGELGYCISHAYGTVYDHPDLIALTVVGDGEAETGPLATSWHSNKFLNPIRDGAVLPVLHLNGYKINNPTLLARISHEELEALSSATGTPRILWRAMTTKACARRWPRPWNTASWRSASSRMRRGRAARHFGRAGPWSFCEAPRAGRPRGRWTDTTWKASGARTRSRYRTSTPTQLTCNCWKNGCTATSRRSTSIKRAGSSPNCGRCRLRGLDG